jgi:hypothetical protein
MTAKAGTAPDEILEFSADDLVDASPCGSRPMRADAVKNRARILEAAEEIFATEGVSVPIDTVAERAGLGVGTLYRHFPTKEALFEAIVVDRPAAERRPRPGNGSFLVSPPVRRSGVGQT